MSAVQLDHLSVVRPSGEPGPLDAVPPIESGGPTFRDKLRGPGVSASLSDGSDQTSQARDRAGSVSSLSTAESAGAPPAAEASDSGADLNDKRPAAPTDEQENSPAGLGAGALPPAGQPAETKPPVEPDGTQSTPGAGDEPAVDLASLVRALSAVSYPPAAGTQSRAGERASAPPDLLAVTLQNVLPSLPARGDESNFGSGAVDPRSVEPLLAAVPVGGTQPHGLSSVADAGGDAIPPDIELLPPPGEPAPGSALEKPRSAKAIVVAESLDSELQPVAAVAEGPAEEPPTGTGRSAPLAAAGDLTNDDSSSPGGRRASAPRDRAQFPSDQPADGEYILITDPPWPQNSGPLDGALSEAALSTGVAGELPAGDGPTSTPERYPRASAESHRVPEGLELAGPIRPAGSSSASWLRFADFFARGGQPAVDPSQPGPDYWHFLQRVTRGVLAAQERGGVVHLRLTPPALGRLHLEVTVREGALLARIETETPAARALLLDGLGQLRERLAELEVKIQRFQVDLKYESGGGQSGRRDERGDDQGTGLAAAPHDNNAATPALPRPRESVAALDLLA